MSTSQTADPYERYGWLLWGAWLIFLIFPIGEALGASSTFKIVIGLVATAVFGVIYVLGFIAMTGKGPLAARPGWQVLTALVVVVAASAPAIGLGVLSFMPFLQALGMFRLPRPLNWWWAGLVVTTTVVLPAVIDPSWGWPTKATSTPRCVMS